MGIILKGKKAWIKGDPTDNLIKESSKAEYGEAAHKWLETIKSTVDNFDLIAQVYGRVQDANAEQRYIGTTSTQATIHEGAPTVTMMNDFRFILQDSTKVIHKIEEYRCDT